MDYHRRQPRRGRPLIARVWARDCLQQRAGRGINRPESQQAAVTLAADAVGGVIGAPGTSPITEDPESPTIYADGSALSATSAAPGSNRTTCCTSHPRAAISGSGPSPSAPTGPGHKRSLPAGNGSAPCPHQHDQHEQPQQQGRRTTPAQSEPARTRAHRAPPRDHPGQPIRHQPRKRTAAQSATTPHGH